MQDDLKILDISLTISHKEFIGFLSYFSMNGGELNVHDYPYFSGMMATLPGKVFYYFSPNFTHVIDASDPDQVKELAEKTKQRGVIESNAYLDELNNSYIDEINESTRKKIIQLLDLDIVNAIELKRSQKQKFKFKNKEIDLWKDFHFTFYWAHLVENEGLSIEKAVFESCNSYWDIAIEEINESKKEPLLKLVINFFNSLEEDKRKLFVKDTLTKEVMGSLLLKGFDDLFYSLECQKGKTLLTYWDLLENELDDINPFTKDNKDKAGYMKVNQKKSMERFHPAKIMSKQYANKAWLDFPDMRYGQIAEEIHNAINKSPNSVNLKKSPTITTIKKWIRELAPSEECLKSGRPKK